MDSATTNRAYHPTLERQIRGFWGPQTKPSRYSGGYFTQCQGMAMGLETRHQPQTYDWHGLQRGVRPERPIVVLQYTLAGAGCYQDARGLRRLGPGDLFTAIIPGNHRYWLPVDSPTWTFVWLLFSHDYIIPRMTSLQATAGAVWSLPPDALVLAGLLEVIKYGTQTTHPAPLGWEERLFPLYFAFARTAETLAHPDDERTRLLEQVRTLARKQLRHPLAVKELAAHFHMSRSAFSHHFTAVTGTTPAACMLELRLQEATQLLLHTRQNLATIASATGFADANHLCKVFRRWRHMSPGMLRQYLKSD